MLGKKIPDEPKDIMVRKTKKIGREGHKNKKD